MKRHIIGRLALAAIGLSLVGGVAIAQTYGNGPLISTPGAPVYISQALVPVATPTAAATLVLKAAPGNLFSVFAANASATAGFMVVTNTTTAATSGTITPLACAALPANGNATINYNPGPSASYSTGISVSLTSAATCFTVTTGLITGYISGTVQ